MKEACPGAEIAMLIGADVSLRHSYQAAHVDLTRENGYRDEAITD